MIELTPSEIVKELDRYIVGQKLAKRAVAIALRNRWRRRKVKKPMRDEILPKNILMVGPTGVGKTEIARRISKLSGSPFIKVEATKFTEVGYVGRDVESIVRDLTDSAITMVKETTRKKVKEKAEEKAEERILDVLVGENSSQETREKFREKLRGNSMNDKEIEIEVQDSGNAGGFSSMDIPGVPGGQMGLLNIGDVIGKAFGGRTKTKRMTIGESYDVLISEESDKLVDEESIIKQAIDLVENDGIVFIDEMDKISSRSESKSGEVSREGVQRDLLPLIEGTTVSTKYGAVKTDHILFIASGAFQLASPSDLLPELQGRLPIRVELNALTESDFIRILKEPESSLPKQYTSLMKTEGIELNFTEDGIKEIASISAHVNKNVENIGARRLHTIMEKLLEEISFEASNIDDTEIIINDDYVKNNVSEVIQNTDLSKFIL